MSYAIKYDLETLPGRNKAMADVVEYIGQDRADKIGRGILDGTIETVEQLRLVFSFVGIHGAPVIVFGEKYGIYA